ncbi:hypothetical protein [Priestia taiwanensis]|uniref:Uncharacterized protein n=1 Tax=Priestia taiwanensis TaxID=1347902 RepID=A0A917EQD0_9BACI|nr:hypothetical protein [Priestia taiwanensis]MBM7364032.1 hypothetical protein [Priestia taiwanensis]GGE71107.1 hypothetical protein GCM10007140_21220 [Priestia taiwanensis]
MTKTAYIGQLILGIIFLIYFLFDTGIEGTYRFVDLRAQGILENHLTLTTINDDEAGILVDIDKFIFMLGISVKPYICIFIFIYLIIISVLFIKKRDN